MHLNHRQMYVLPYKLKQCVLQSERPGSFRPNIYCLEGVKVAAKHHVQVNLNLNDHGGVFADRRITNLVHAIEHMAHFNQPYRANMPPT